jgi:DNA-binding LacI/PurR family transcriptional regulator
MQQNRKNMKTGEITIKDIARKLGISVSTVSRAMRNLPDVNKQTREAVHELAAQLNYTPNLIAKNLKTNKTNTIGVIIPGFIMHYYASAISGIQNEASKAGYNIIIGQSDESYETEMRNVETMVKSRVDGFIVSVSKETKNFQHFVELERRGLPLVFFNRVCPEIHTSRVIVDDYKGAFKAVEYLVQTGCKKIAHIAGPSNLLVSRNRLNGYLDVLKKFNLEICNDLIAECDFSVESGRTATEKLLERCQPDAIFVVNDAAAFGCLQILKGRKIRIPDDISVVGFTNEPLSDLIEPTLTTVSQPSYEIGRSAAQLFLRRVEEGIHNFSPQTVMLNTELIIRNSTRKLVEMNDHQQHGSE